MKIQKNSFTVKIILLPALLLMIFSCATKVLPERDPMETVLEMQTAFREIARDVLPIVVKLEIVEVTRQQAPEGDDFPFSPWHFGPFDPENDPEKEREFLNQGIGSGVIVGRDEDRYFVLTNAHVVEKADSVRVGLSDGREFDGEIVGTDERKDLALVKFTSDAEDIPVAVLGDSDSTQVGDWVIAVGNPFGYESTMTSGIVSAIGRRGPLGNISDFIQTDAAINQGNSGGALVNLHGELIGINTWISTPTGGNIGLSFSIPINNVKKAVRDFIEVGEVRYGWFGISIAELLKEAALEIGVDEMEGAFVYHVFRGSPAEAGGILPGDFITKIGNTDIEDSNHLIQLVGDLEPEKEIDITFIRDGKTEQIALKIGLRSDSESIRNNSEDLWPGIGVVPLTDGLRREFGVEDGERGVVVSEVEPKTPFQVIGVRFGDILTEINDTSIYSMNEFYKIISSIDPGDFSVTILRNGSSITISAGEGIDTE